MSLSVPFCERFEVSGPRARRVVATDRQSVCFSETFSKRFAKASRDSSHLTLEPPYIISGVVYASNRSAIHARRTEPDALQTKHAPSFVRHAATRWRHLCKVGTMAWRSRNCGILARSVLLTTTLLPGASSRCQLIILLMADCAIGSSGLEVLSCRMSTNTLAC